MVSTEASLTLLRQGTVIPAHLLALNAQRQLDTQRQRALTRYYLDAGAGGVAVGVHSTQFAIREFGMYRPVLELAMATAQQWEPLGGKRPLAMVAGLAGPGRGCCILTSQTRSAARFRPVPVAKGWNRPRDAWRAGVRSAARPWHSRRARSDAARRRSAPKAARRRC